MAKSSWLLPTGYGKSLIFQLLPDAFDWYCGVIIIVLFEEHRQRILICKGFTFTRVSHRALKDNIRYSCIIVFREPIQLISQSLPGRAATEWKDYWERDWSKSRLQQVVLSFVERELILIITLILTLILNRLNTFILPPVVSPYFIR